MKEERAKGVGRTRALLGSHHREALSIQDSTCSCRFGGAIAHTGAATYTNARARAHMHMRSRFGLCFELIPTTGKAHRRLADNNIILWPSYGNMVLLLWRKYEYYSFQRQLRELHGCHASQLQ